MKTQYVTWTMHAVAGAIKRAGVVPGAMKLVPSDEPDMTDDMIEITDKIHVQVGDTYAIVVKEVDADSLAFEMGEPRTDTDLLIEDLRKALAS